MSCAVHGAGTPVVEVTVKVTPLLAWPPTVTTTGPVVAPAGTGVVRLVSVQLIGVVGVPLTVTVLEPCVVPKFAPTIVSAVPTAPDVGVRLVSVGGAGAPPMIVAVAVVEFVAGKLSVTLKVIV